MVRRSLAVLLVLAVPFACRKKTETRADPAQVPLVPPVSASAPASVVPSASASVAPPRKIPVPACTPSPRITWQRSPEDTVSCSDMLVNRAPMTLAIAKGTPVRLHLRAMKGFKGTYSMVGAPPGAKLDPKTGDFEWTARTGPVEIGFAAIEGGECATGGIAIEIVEDDKTRINLLRWSFYVPLRDAELEAIGTDEKIDQSYWDGESPEMTANRRAREKKELLVARTQYLDSLMCGHVPGASMGEEDVDGDGKEDLVSGLEHGDSFVLLKQAVGYSVFGRVEGWVQEHTVDHRGLFLASGSAENSTWTHVAWVDGGALRKLSLDGVNGDYQVEWHHVMTGGSDGVTMTTGGTKVEYVWRDGDFIKK